MTATSHSSPTPSVVGIQFKPTGLIHDYDGAGLDLARGDRVVVQLPKAITLATVARLAQGCLRYEYDTYLELKRERPKLGATVTSLKGDGVFVRHNILKQTAIVEVEATLEDLLEQRAE